MVMLGLGTNASLCETRQPGGLGPAYWNCEPKEKRADKSAERQEPSLYRYRSADFLQYTGTGTLIIMYRGDGRI